jgi:hypothetical protein
MWCGSGHLHKECPEKTNNASTPACCNLKLVDGEKTHPSKYRGCSHAKEEIRRRKAKRTPKNKTGRVFSSFSSNYTTPGLSFETALGNKSSNLIHTAFQWQLQPQQRQQKPGQSVLGTNVYSLPLDNMFRVVVVCSAADYDRVQRCHVRRSKNNGNYKNCLESNEAEWPCRSSSG